MPIHKNLYLAFVFLFCITFGYGQIITSKKEAVKKGIYQKPTESESKDEVAEVVAEPTKKPKKKSKEKKNKTTTSTANLKDLISDENAEDIEISEPESYIATQIINNAKEFLGVRYRSGGTTTDGMDCSGMVTAVFNLFDIPIPRSSRDMATVGEKVDISEVKKGDLIFFKTNGRRVISHVGLVIETIGDEIKFIHSSTSQGVIISSTKESYYKKTFAQVNRILSDI